MVALRGKLTIRRSWKNKSSDFRHVEFSFPYLNIQGKIFLGRQIVYGQNRRLGLCVSLKEVTETAGGSGAM